MTLPRLLADVGEDAAVNIENQAVDEVGSLGGEEHGGAAQILWNPVSTNSTARISM